MCLLVHDKSITCLYRNRVRIDLKKFIVPFSNSNNRIANLGDGPPCRAFESLICWSQQGCLLLRAAFTAAIRCSDRFRIASVHISTTLKSCHSICYVDITKATLKSQKVSTKAGLPLGCRLPNTATLLNTRPRSSTSAISPLLMHI